MTVRFLCDSHRMLLSNQPAQAIKAWQESFDRGSLLYEKKEWQKALCFLGSAYETAEIIMINREVSADNAYELLASSAVLLANNFLMLGYQSESRKIYHLAINCLEQEISQSSTEQLGINSYLGHLYRNLWRLDCYPEKTGVAASTTIHLMSATMH